MMQKDFYDFIAILGIDGAVNISIYYTHKYASNISVF